MNQDIEQELNDLFAKDRQRRDDALSDAEKAARAVERDLETFAMLRDEVIKPELDKIAEFVVRHGWDAKVASGPSKRVHPDAVAVQEVSIFFAPERVDDWHPEQFAHVRFSCVPGHFKVSIAESDILPGRGGSSGSGQSVEMNKVTPNWVSARVTQLLKRILEK